jgi:HAE1 family hydrophobic/amphiphilic exporter-1
VDYTNTLRERGRPLFDAVLEAGPVRMRPVLMTAASTIFGMLPLALGRGDGSEWRSPMAMIAIGGLAASTFLTLLIVPVVYTLVDDAQSGVARGWRALQAQARRRRGGGTSMYSSDPGATDSIKPRTRSSSASPPPFTR